MSNLESQSLLEKENSFTFWIHGSNRTCREKVGDLFIMAIQGIAFLICFFLPLLATAGFLVGLWAFFHYVVNGGN